MWSRRRRSPSAPRVAPRRRCRARRRPSSPSRVTAPIAARTSSASCGPSDSDTGVAAMRTTTSSPSTSSSEMCGSAAHRRPDGLLEQRLHVARPDVGAQARAQVDGRGLAQRDDRRRQHDVVRDHDRVLALREGRVEQPERRDDALDLAREPARLQAHAVADPERPRRDQHHAGDQVPERLLRGETEDDGGDRATDGQRLGLQPGDAQRHERRHGEEHEPDQEADGPRGRRVHPAEQRGRGEAAEVARQRPAQHHHRDRRGDAHRRVDAEQLLAAQVRDSVIAEQRHDDHELAAGAAGALGGLQGQAARPGGRVSDVRSAR